MGLRYAVVTSVNRDDRKDGGAELFQFGDVGTVLLSDVRNRVPRLAKVLGSLAAHAAHRNPLGLSPFRKIRQLWLGEADARSRGCCRGQHVFRVQFYIFFTDASARAVTLHAVDVDANFSRQPTHMGRGGHRIAMLGAGNLTELHRHGNSRLPGFRLCFLRKIRRQSLFFCFAFSFHCELKSEARGLLP